MPIVPNSPPAQRLEDSLKMLERHKVTDDVALLGIRGYYLNTMGKEGANDREMYDDAIFLISPEFYASFNANVDPGAYYEGVANLATGLWKYKIGIHGLSKPKDRQYRALVQADKVTVNRDGGKVQTGWFGINIHKGGYDKVSSIGCQTIYPDQWRSFFTSVENQLKRFKQSEIPYLLIENV